MSDDFQVYYCTYCLVSVRVPLSNEPPMTCPACNKPGLELEPNMFDQMVGAGNLPAPGDRLGRTVGEVKAGRGEPEIDWRAETVEPHDLATHGSPTEEIGPLVYFADLTPADEKLHDANLALLAEAYPLQEPGGITLSEARDLWVVGSYVAARRLKELGWRRVDALLPSGRRGFLYYPPREKE